MFKKGVVCVVLLFIPVLLSGVSFEEFPIGAGYPWFYGENIPSDSVGSIHSLKELGFNSVYWSIRDNHLNLVRADSMKGYFYSSSWFPSICRSSMDYIFETYTDPEDTLDYNPTAWDSLFVDEYTADDSAKPNGYAVRIDMGRSGTLLSHLKSASLNKFWGQKAIYSGKYATSVIYTNKDQTARLDDLFDVDTACRNDPLCSLDSLCPGEVVIDSLADTTDYLVYRTQGVGVIVIPRIRVANVDTTDSTVILCRIIIQTNKDTVSHDIMRCDFKDNLYHTDIGNFSFMFEDNETDLEDIVVLIPDGETAPDTFWIDYIELRDAFANYIYRKAHIDPDTTMLLNHLGLSDTNTVIARYFMFDEPIPSQYPQLFLLDSLGSYVSYWTLRDEPIRRCLVPLINLILYL